MGLGLPPLKLKILFESNPPKSRVLLRRLAVFPPSAERGAAQRGRAGEQVSTPNAGHPAQPGELQSRSSSCSILDGSRRATTSDSAKMTQVEPQCYTSADCRCIQVEQSSGLNDPVHRLLLWDGVAAEGIGSETAPSLSRPDAHAGACGRRAQGVRLFS